MQGAISTLKREPKPAASQFPGRELRSRLVRGSAWALAARMAAVLANLIVNALAARLLPPSDLGVYFLTLTVVSVAATLSMVGLNQIVVRVIAKCLASGETGAARAAARKVIALGALLSFAAALVLGAGTGSWLADSVFDSPAMRGVVLWLALLVPVLTVRLLLAEIFRGLHDVRLASLLGEALPAGLLAAGLALAWSVQRSASLRELLILTMAAGTTTIAVAALLLRRRVATLPRTGAVGRRELLAAGVPQLVTNLAFLALTQADLVILGAVRPKAEVAVYGAGARLAALLALPLLIFNAVVPSLIAELHTQGRREKLEQTLRLTAALGLIPACLGFAVLALLSGPILGLLYGTYYRQAATVVLILAAAQFVNAACGSCGLTLTMAGHQGALMRITVVAAAATMAIAIPTARLYGAIGVAATMACGLAAQNIGMVLLARRHIGVWTYALLSPARIRSSLRGTA